MHPSPPRAGRDYAGTADCHVIGISIHPPHAGRDNDPRGRATERRDFNPPAPCGAGLADYLDMTNHVQFQSTRPMRGGTTGKPSRGATGAFQSTRPVRGGTRGWAHISSPMSYFNPPAPCGAGRKHSRQITVNLDFNPPAPCGAGHCKGWMSSRATSHFNPPAPCGAGRYSKRKWSVYTTISIHPPRAGRDKMAADMLTFGRFQSTRPVRGGTCVGLEAPPLKLFQSTRPVRGGTNSCVAYTRSIIFQSTRPVRGGTKHTG